MTSFWEYVGLSLLAIFLLVFVGSYRRQFFFVIKNNKAAVLSLSGVNELINIIAKMIMNFASILAPLALVWTVNAFQPIFVLLIGIFLASTFPTLTDEDINKRHIFQKSVSMAIMFVGAYLLNS